MALLTLHHIDRRRLVDGHLHPRAGGPLCRRPGGRPSPLPELPVQYADYAVWQRERLAGRGARVAARLVARAPGGGPRRPGAADRPAAPAVQSLRGGERPFALPPELSRRLRGLSRREGATLFMTAARRLPGPARPPLGAVGRAGGLAGGQPQPRRDRGADRLLRQHPGVRRRPGGRSGLPRAARPLAPGEPRRLRPPGGAVRAPGRGAAAAARPVAPAAVPGDARLPERAFRSPGAPRPDPEPAPGGERHVQVRAQPGGEGEGGGGGVAPGRIAGVQRRAVRSARPRSASSGSFETLLARRRGGPGDGGWETCRCSPSRAPAAPGVERCRASRMAAACLHELFEAQAARTPEAPRRWSPAPSGSPTRARRPRRPVGAAPGLAGGRAGGAGGHLR